MDLVSINIENTPNPHARKFVLDRQLIASGAKVSYRQPKECEHIPLALNIFDVEGIKQIHFFQNNLTISKAINKTWDEIEPILVTLLKSMIPAHNPDFEMKNRPSKDHFTDDMKLIDKILDDSIRPYLQADGGDLRILQMEKNILTVTYEGACGSCPSSEAGTLQAITNVLREKFDPCIEVVTIPGEYAN